MMKKPVRLIELFAGIGSQAMALRDIGAQFATYRVIEFDKYAIQSYNAIHGTFFPTMDITKIHAADLAITQTNIFNYIMTYSFPCQDLSPVGKQAGMQKDSGTRSGLLWEVERLLNECEELPQVLLMENVTQVHGTKNKADFIKWCEFLESKGYKNYYQDMNAKDYGIPQNRNRCFMLSKLDNVPFTFPAPQPLAHPMRDFLEPCVDSKYYLKSDLFINNSFLQETRGNGFRFMPHVKKNANIARAITTHAGGRMDDNFIIDINTNIERLVFESKNKELCKNVKSKDVRKLTPRECWRLMGFTDADFDKAAAVCSDAQLYKQAGNSIVKNVLMAIFNKLLEG